MTQLIIWKRNNHPNNGNCHREKIVIFQIKFYRWTGNLKSEVAEIGIKLGIKHIPKFSKFYVEKEYLC